MYTMNPPYTETLLNYTTHAGTSAEPIVLPRDCARSEQCYVSAYVWRRRISTESST